jgi:hypothetical protein
MASKRQKERSAVKSARNLLDETDRFLAEIRSGEPSLSEKQVDHLIKDSTKAQEKLLAFDGHLNEKQKLAEHIALLDGFSNIKVHLRCIGDILRKLGSRVLNTKNRLRCKKP